MLITPNPDMMSEKHARRRSHRVQIMQVGPAKKGALPGLRRAVVQHGSRGRGGRKRRFQRRLR